MNWFYLALLAPLLYAVTNLIDDNMLQFVYESPYMATALAGFFGALPLLSLFFLHFSQAPLKIGYFAAAAGILTAVYFLLYFRALLVEQPSVVIALFSLVPATLPFLAHFILHENLNGLEILGLIIILFASLMITVVDIKKFKFSAALLPVVGAVIIVDIISLLTKYVYQNVSFYTGFIYFSFGLGLGGLYFLCVALATKTAKEAKNFKISLAKVIPMVILGGLVGLSADFTLNLAISRGPVSVIKVIEQGAQPVFVLLIALVFYPVAPIFFREALEGNRLKKFGLMIVIILGLVILSVGAKAT